MTAPDRTQRSHVQQRLRELDAEMGKKPSPGDLVRTTAEHRLEMYHSYLKAVARSNPPEPEVMTNRELLEWWESWSCDSHRYSGWNEEHNLAIVAYASEWFSDIRAEILKRMRAK